MAPASTEDLVMGSATAEGPLQKRTTAFQEQVTARREHEEYQYLDLVRDIMEHGEHRPDRCGRSVARETLQN